MIVIFHDVQGSCSLTHLSYLNPFHERTWGKAAVGPSKVFTGLSRTSLVLLTEKHATVLTIQFT